MKAFRLRLELALGSGAALAVLSVPACGGSAATGGTPEAAGSAGTSTVTHQPTGGGASSTAGSPSIANAGQPTVSIAGAAGAAGDANQPLDPYPTTGLGCSGPDYDGGYYGQCCAEALCYTPENGDDCVDPNDAPNKLGTFYGSGSCLCGGTGIEGPFAANPTHEPEKPGTCCYVISSITCEGRPLLVDGSPLISALMQRCDWIVADLLELST